MRRPERVFNDKSAPPCGFIFPLTMLFTAKIHVGTSGGRFATGLSPSALLQTLPKWANVWGGGCETLSFDDTITLMMPCRWALGTEPSAGSGGVPHVVWEMPPVTPTSALGSLTILPLGTQCWDPGDLTTDPPSNFLAFWFLSAPG